MKYKEMKNTIEGLDIPRYISIGMAACKADPKSIKPPVNGYKEWRVYNSMRKEIEEFKEKGVDIVYEIPIDFD